MNPENNPILFESTATQDFEQAYKKGFMRAILNKLTRSRSSLVSFDELRKKLDIQSQRDMGMQEIEIEKIIGSLNRYQDFDDSFLPRQTHTRRRWENIDRVYLQGEYLPPVEVYQVGEFFFVIDGNHRVSVAREKGQVYIDAHVIELKIPFPLEGKFDWYEILLNQEHIDFDTKTNIRALRPQSKIELSLVGQYQKLLEHIDVHRYYLSQNHECEIPYTEGVCSWYDLIYAPMVSIIRKRKILEHFPKRTEADLYLWIIEHLAYLQAAFHRDISFDEAAGHFAKTSHWLWWSDFLKNLQGKLEEIFKKKT
jgi:hypothetical protein